MKLINHLKTTACLAAAAAFVGCASPGTTYTRSTGRAIDDSATTSRVKSSLNKDSLVKGNDIDVQTFRGNVHLTGFVDHPVQKDRASQIVRNVDGVEWFKNDILVITELPSTRGESMAVGQPMREPSGSEMQQSKGNMKWQKGNSGSSATDTGANQSAKSSGRSAEISEPSGTSSDLSQRVNGHLRSDSALGAQNVQADAAADGKITLRGSVGIESAKDAIEKQVRSVPGVNDVDNQLEVKNQ